MEEGPPTGGGGPDLSVLSDGPDPATTAHMRRTGATAGALAAYLGFRPEIVIRLGAAAALHDVGKAAIPTRILEKPGPLSADERTEVERHPLVGHRILIASRRPDALSAARIALTHHERFDGTGYPHGLSGEEIPIAGRIVAVADVLDALLSDRPYRPALPRSEALALLAAGSGSQFDPAVVEPAIEHAQALIV
jgi:HD-GYP domain-containing protein (c-di-GMP phosphodiesterase class II)